VSGESLSVNCVIFGRFLRRLGLGAAPDRIVLFTQALTKIGFASRKDVKQTGRAIFVRNAQERTLFDAAFDAFWSAMPKELERVAADQGQPNAAEGGRPQPSRGSQATPAVMDVARAHGQSVPDVFSEHDAAARLVQHGDRSFTYSFADALGQKDFSRLNEAELELAHELSRHKRLELGLRSTRRTSPGAGGTLDPRRTLRASLRQYGEPIQLMTRTPRVRPRDVVLLCDISGSMDRYSRLLLQFVHAVESAAGAVTAVATETWLAPPGAKSYKKPSVEAATRLPSVSAKPPRLNDGVLY
jgi:uncharacterized protein